MSDAFSRIGLFLFVLPFGAGALVLAYRQSKKRASTDGPSRSWLDYLLLWPLLFEKSSVDRSRRLLTNRELLGWLIVALLIVVGLVFF
jgi:hypothetical protein